jgi:hypothetical protein
MPVLTLVFYPITAYQCNFIVLFGKITMFFLWYTRNKNEMSSLCHNWCGARVAQWVRSLNLTAHTSLSPIRRGFAPSFVNYKKGCTRLAAASDKVC